MRMKNPKLVAALLIGGTVLLIGGGAVAATLPSNGMHVRMPFADSASSSQVRAPASSASSQITDAIVPPASKAPPSAPPVGTLGSSVPRAGGSAENTGAAGAAPAVVAPKSAAMPPRAPLTYVVKPGDTLSGIAAWFSLHGYGDLYAENARAIGADPNLIRPGERITLGANAMSVKAPA